VFYAIINITFAYSQPVRRVPTGVRVSQVGNHCSKGLECALFLPYWQMPADIVCPKSHKMYSTTSHPDCLGHNLILDHSLLLGLRYSLLAFIDWSFVLLCACYLPHPSTYSSFEHSHNKKTPWPESASELYRPSDSSLPEKLVPNFVDRECHVVGVAVPYGRILGSLDRSRYFSFQVAPQLYSRGWVYPVPDPLLLRKSDSSGTGTRTSGSVTRNSDH
jgi:hypothetical protein